MSLSRSIGHLLTAVHPAPGVAVRQPRDGWPGPETDLRLALPTGGEPRVDGAPPGLPGGEPTTGMPAAPHPVPAAAPLPTGASGGLGTAAPIVESLGLGYHLGSAVERIVVAGGQGTTGLAHLREAVWLIERHIQLAETEGGLAVPTQPFGGDLGDRTGPTDPEPGPAHEVEEPLSFTRELLLTAFRWALILVVLVVMVAVATLVSSWT